MENGYYINVQLIYKDAESCEQALKNLQTLEDTNFIETQDNSILGFLEGETDDLDALIDKLKIAVEKGCIEGYLDTYSFYKTEYFGDTTL